MTSSAMAEAGSIARLGTRVLARGADACHTGRGAVIQLPPQAPVALVRFDCACSAYVPLRRLVADPLPAPPACELSGCRRPRYGDLPYCPRHHYPHARADDGESFEPDAPADVPLRPPVTSGCAIDDGDHKTDDRTTGAGRAPSSAPRARAGTPRAARKGAGAATAPVPKRRPLTRVWPADEIIPALRAWAAEHGRTPRFEDWKAACPDGSRPTSFTVRARFGSWRAALAAAELPANSPAPRVVWPPERIIEAIRAEHARTGRVPRIDDWLASSDDHPAHSTVRHHFPSWSAAIRAAGLEPNRPGRKREPSTPGAGR